MTDITEVNSLFEDDPGSLEEVVDEDDAEDLRLDDVDTKVWLVKVIIMLFLRCFSFFCLIRLYIRFPLFLQKNGSTLMKKIRI